MFFIFLPQVLELTELVLVQLFDVLINVVHSLRDLLEFDQLRLLQLLSNVFLDQTEIGCEVLLLVIKHFPHGFFH